MTPDSEIAILQAALTKLRADPTSGAAFSILAKNQQALTRALPPRFNEVLLQLLDRLESSALFIEESCSFSHSGLIDSLQMWIDKARLQLDKK